MVSFYRSRVSLKVSKCWTGVCVFCFREEEVIACSPFRSLKFRGSSQQKCFCVQQRINPVSFWNSIIHSLCFIRLFGKKKQCFPIVTSFGIESRNNSMERVSACGSTFHDNWKLSKACCTSDIFLLSICQIVFLPFTVPRAHNKR